MLSVKVLRQLNYEMDKGDPWRLETNPFEQARYDLLLELLAQPGHYESALEVGCAAGVFTALLFQRCSELRVVDVLPQALARCRGRVGPLESVRYCVADISETNGWGETYDLIVVSEVLYYLETRAKIELAVAKMCSWLSPGGILVFGSAIDKVSSRWGLPFGAETALREWSKYLRETMRKRCVGNSPNEHALIVKYWRDPDFRGPPKTL